MPSDLERVVNLLRHGHGDPTEVADILGTDLATIQSVLTGGGALPSQGGGGGLGVGPLVTPIPQPAVGVYQTPQDPTKSALVIVTIEASLQAGEHAAANLMVGIDKSNTAVAAWSVERAADGDPSARLYTATLSTLLAPGDTYALDQPSGVGLTISTYERTLG